MRCPSCHADNPVAGRFCSACGVDLGEAATTPASAPARTSSPPSSDEGRFPAGTLLAGRYRILGLLGRGGMGEVYRASDLTLNQPVALKFLPEAMARNEQLLARFHGEVRIARQVSHPNVCRVYDIGEIDGSPYISMEYVDGEDLGALLRRIGRLPPDKAVEIARRLCAGLAAAHDKGVLHRDLKPANIMILVGGHVLVGTTVGLGAHLVVLTVRQWREGLLVTPNTLSLEGSVFGLGGLSTLLSAVVLISLFLFFLFFLVRVALRRDWLAGAAVVVLLTLGITAPNQAAWRMTGIILTGLGLGTAVWVLLRFGVLSLTTGLFMFVLLVNFPMTSDLSAWYSRASLVVLAALLALSVWSFRAALGGRRVWKDDFLDA